MLKKTVLTKTVRVPIGEMDLDELSNLFITSNKKIFTTSDNEFLQVQKAGS